MTPANAILRNSLRLLTPEEVEDLTSEFVSFNKIKLTDVLELGLNIDDEEARERIKKKGRADIIEITGTKVELKGDEKGSIETQNSESKEDKDEREVERDNQSEKIQQEKIEVGPKKERGLFDEEEVIVEEVIGGNEFILGEKDKLRDSNWKLKGQSLLALYKKNSAIDIDQEKAHSKKRKKEKKTGGGSSQSGVLIDKDHQ